MYRFVPCSLVFPAEELAPLRGLLLSHDLPGPTAGEPPAPQPRFSRSRRLLRAPNTLASLSLRALRPLL